MISGASSRYVLPEEAYRKIIGPKTILLTNEQKKIMHVPEDSLKQFVAKLKMLVAFADLLHQGAFKLKQDCEVAIRSIEGDNPGEMSYHLLSVSEQRIAEVLAKRNARFLKQK